MKKIGLLAVLVAVIAACGVVNVATASADANCTNHGAYSGMQKKGNGATALLYFNPYLICSGVEEIELKRFPSGYTYATGFYDHTQCLAGGSCYWIPGKFNNCNGPGACASPQCTQNPDSSNQYGGGTGYQFYAASVCYYPIWFYGGQTRQLAGLFYYRAKNSQYHTWGPYHLAQTPLYYINN